MSPSSGSRGYGGPDDYRGARDGRGDAYGGNSRGAPGPREEYGRGDGGRFEDYYDDEYDDPAGPDYRTGGSGGRSAGSGGRNGGGPVNDKRIDNVMSDLMNQMTMEPEDEKFCGGCDKVILDESQAFEIEAMKQFFHADCFRCYACGDMFSEDLPYIPLDGKAYCERDYEIEIEENCAGCKKPIYNDERPINALGRVWHENHLRCAGCQQPIRGNFFEHKDVVYCAQDYARLVAPKCKGCEKAIQGETIVALEGAWHKRCFVCTGCTRPFTDRSFYVLDNMPYCRLDYHRANNSLCGSCSEPIEGPCAEVVEIDKRFHPYCWCCGLCNEPLTDVYYSYDGAVYCEDDIRVVYKPNKSNKASKRRTLLTNFEFAPFCLHPNFDADPVGPDTLDGVVAAHLRALLRGPQTRLEAAGADVTTRRGDDASVAPAAVMVQSAVLGDGMSSETSSAAGPLESTYGAAAETAAPATAMAQSATVDEPTPTSSSASTEGPLASTSTEVPFGPTSGAVMHSDDRGPAPTSTDAPDVNPLGPIPQSVDADADAVTRTADGEALVFEDWGRTRERRAVLEVGRDAVVMAGDVVGMGDTMQKDDGDNAGELHGGSLKAGDDNRLLEATVIGMEPVRVDKAVEDMTGGVVFEGGFEGTRVFEGELEVDEITETGIAEIKVVEGVGGADIKEKGVVGAVGGPVVAANVVAEAVGGNVDDDAAPNGGHESRVPPLLGVEPLGPSPVQVDLAPAPVLESQDGLVAVEEPKGSKDSDGGPAVGLEPHPVALEILPQAGNPTPMIASVAESGAEDDGVTENGPLRIAPE
ncbi:hypothetical protein HK101_004822, partial [Irineochytrium annulatum]